MIVVFDWARAFLSLLRGQVATCLSKGDFPAYLGICYRKKEEESNDFPNSVRKKSLLGLGQRSNQQNGSLLFTSEGTERIKIS